MKRTIILFALSIVSQSLANPIYVSYINEVQTLPISRIEIHQEPHWGQTYHAWKIVTSIDTFRLPDFTLPSGGFIVFTDTQLAGFTLNPVTDSITLYDSNSYSSNFRRQFMKWPGTFAPPASGRSAAMVGIGGNIWWTDQMPSFGAENPGQYPVAIGLSSFTAQGSNGTVVLRWRTESETNNCLWLIERATGVNDNFVRITALTAHTGSNTNSEYSYCDRDVEPNVDYYYRLGDQDISGIVAWHGPVLASAKALRQERQVPRVPWINVYPNPSFGQSVLSFLAPHGAYYTVAIYDMNGRLIRLLERGNGEDLYITVFWDGRDDRGRRVASGTYLAVLKASGQRAVGKITWVR